MTEVEINKQNLTKLIKNKQSFIFVSKYWDKETTGKLQRQIINYLGKENANLFFGLGENRIENLIKKNIAREKCHFIGNLQSRDFVQIVKYCNFIHSLQSVKHAEKLNKICEQENLTLKVFLQIKISQENSKSGISQENFEQIFYSISKLESLEIIGIAGMGKGENFTRKEKLEEFQKLIDLRNKYFPGKFISAGTSRDWEIALPMKEGIIMRLGKCLVEV